MSSTTSYDPAARVLGLYDELSEDLVKYQYEYRRTRRMERVILVMCNAGLISGMAVMCLAMVNNDLFLLAAGTFFVGSSTAMLIATPPGRFSDFWLGLEDRTEEHMRDLNRHLPDRTMILTDDEWLRVP